MKRLDIVDKAYKFAKRKHKGQLDDCGHDYFKAHLKVVADIVSKITPDKQLIASALLHDTIEDTETSYAELFIKFGKPIADYVMELTHEGDKVNGFYYPRLKSKGAILIKYADRLSNLSRMEAWNKERQAHYIRRSKFWKTSVDDIIIKGQGN